MKIAHGVGWFPSPEKESGWVSAHPGQYVEEIERLSRLLAWCRPRLKADAYRKRLDYYIANPQEPDQTPLVQS